MVEAITSRRLHARLPLQVLLLEPVGELEEFKPRLVDGAVGEGLDVLVGEHQLELRPRVVKGLRGGEERENGREVKNGRAWWVTLRGSAARRHQCSARESSWARQPGSAAACRGRPTARAESGPPIVSLFLEKKDRSRRLGTSGPRRRALRKQIPQRLSGFTRIARVGVLECRALRRSEDRRGAILARTRVRTRCPVRGVCRERCLNRPFRGEGTSVPATYSS